MKQKQIIYFAMREMYEAGLLDSYSKYPQKRIIALSNILIGRLEEAESLKLNKNKITRDWLIEKGFNETVGYGYISYFFNRKEKRLSISKHGNKDYHVFSDNAKYHTINTIGELMALYFIKYGERL